MYYVESICKNHHHYINVIASYILQKRISYKSSGESPRGMARGASRGANLIQCRGYREYQGLVAEGARSWES